MCVSPLSERAEREQVDRMEIRIEKSRRNWVILIAVISMIAILVSLLAVIPMVFGNNYVSASVDLNFALGPGNPSIEVVYKDRVLSVCFVTFNINVTNSYFVSAQVPYNGINYAILVYNQTVDAPEDVEANRPFLVWGAFHARQLMNPVHLGYPHAYEFYISHRNLSNFTASIAPGTSTYHVFASRVTEPIWWGQNCFTGEYVTPGTYYIYAIAFGKVSAPFSLTITSILRTK